MWERLTWFEPPLLAEGRDVAFGPDSLPILRFLYVGAACVLCFASVGPMSFVELAGVPAAVLLLALLPWFWRTALRVFCQPLVWAILAWGVWGVISLNWSPNRENGLWELASLRYGWWLIVIWPALRYRRHLILALALGFVAAVIAQGVLALIRVQGWTAWDFSPAFKDRNAGWWVHPAVCGYMLVAALGLHAPAALIGKGRVAWVARAAMLLMWVGIFATGTRGTMLGGAAITILVGCIGVWFRLRGATPAVRARVLAVAAVSMVLGTAAVTAVSMSDTNPGRRIREGVREVAGAVGQNNYATFTGARIKFVHWAWDQFKANPLTGVGMGGYQTTIRNEVAGRPSPTKTIPVQAHNTFAHAAATLGLPGLLIALTIAALALRGGFAGLAGRHGTYDAGPAWALVGVLFTTPFDAIYVNSPPSALLAVLLALCLWNRPRVAPLGTLPAAGRDGEGWGTSR